MSDAMDHDVREVIRRRVEFRERDGHERLLLNHVDLRALLDAADERDRLAAQVERVRELTYESDDGTRYGHDGHSPIAGYAECPGCWSDAIETVLGGGGDE